MSVFAITVGDVRPCLAEGTGGGMNGCSVMRVIVRVRGEGLSMTAPIHTRAILHISDDTFRELIKFCRGQGH